MLSITSSQIDSLVVVRGNILLPSPHTDNFRPGPPERSESLEVNPPTPPSVPLTGGESVPGQDGSSPASSSSESAKDRVKYRWFVSLMHYDGELDAYVRYGGILSPIAYARAEEAEREGRLQPVPYCCRKEVFAVSFLPENDPIHRRTYVKNN